MAEDSKDVRVRGLLQSIHMSHKNGWWVVVTSEEGGGGDAWRYKDIESAKDCLVMALHMYLRRG